MLWIAFAGFALLALGCFGFAVLCAADPEGRAGNYIVAALSGCLIFTIVAVIFLVVAAQHALKG